MDKMKDKDNDPDSEFESVWHGVADELRKVRRRRRASQTSMIGLLLLGGVLWMNHALAPKADPQGRLVEGPASRAAVEDTAAAAEGFAVLVYDGSGMRFEIMDGEQLADQAIDFSLQPVVMTTAGGAW